MADTNIKKIYNDSIFEALKGAETLQDGKDRVMAYAAIAQALAPVVAVDRINSCSCSTKKASKPMPPATEEEKAAPPKAKAAAKEAPVQQEAPAPVEEKAVKEEAPAVAAPVQSTDEDAPVFESWEDPAACEYYAAQLDDLYNTVAQGMGDSVNDGTEGLDAEAAADVQNANITDGINKLMEEFSNGLVKTFDDSTPASFIAFLTYVKGCLADAEEASQASA